MYSCTNIILMLSKCIVKIYCYCTYVYILYEFSYADLIGTMKRLILSSRELSSGSISVVRRGNELLNQNVISTMEAFIYCLGKGELLESREHSIVTAANQNGYVPATAAVEDEDVTAAASTMASTTDLKGIAESSTWSSTRRKTSSRNHKEGNSKNRVINKNSNNNPHSQTSAAAALAIIEQLEAELHNNYS